jgi:uncharacterized lipoprotein YajG
MDLRAFRLIGLVGTGALILTLSGCGMTHTIKTSDIPLLQTGSPLKGVKSRTFAFKNFKDGRGVGSHLVFARWDQRSPVIVEERIMTLDQPVAVVVAKAIRDELERNGHKGFQYSSEKNQDFIVEGSIYKFWLSTDHSLLSEKATGDVAVKLTITNTLDERLVLIKRYEGEYSLSGGFIGKEDTATLKEHENILIKALLGMLREISIDPELVEFIGK